MATVATPWASSQSARASKSAVIAPKVWTVETTDAVGVDPADAGDDGLLVDVESGAAIVNDFHDVPSNESGRKRNRPSRWDDLGA